MGSSHSILPPLTFLRSVQIQFFWKGQSQLGPESSNIGDWRFLKTFLILLQKRNCLNRMQSVGIASPHLFLSNLAIINLLVIPVISTGNWREVFPKGNFMKDINPPDTYHSIYLVPRQQCQ